jgi:1-acyl-sn-glycerol-3-phosphate acyltransferase
MPGLTLYRISRAVLRPLLVAFWRLRVVGGGHRPTGAAIVVANHDSLADVFVLGAAFDRPLRFLAKQELWSNRVVGGLMDALGGIPVARARGDVGAVAAAARALDQGDVVAIFPQGTTLGPPDRPWQRGAARLALTTGVPLVPVAIVGAGRGLRPGTWLPRPTRVRVVVGAPIVVQVTSPTIPATRDLTRRVKEAVEALGAVPA